MLPACLEQCYGHATGMLGAMPLILILIHIYNLVEKYVYIYINI